MTLYSSGRKYISILIALVWQLARCFHQPNSSNSFRDYSSPGLQLVMGHPRNADILLPQERAADRQACRREQTWAREESASSRWCQFVLVAEVGVGKRSVSVRSPVMVSLCIVICVLIPCLPGDDDALQFCPPCLASRALVCFSYGSCCEPVLVTNELNLYIKTSAWLKSLCNLNLKVCLHAFGCTTSVHNKTIQLRYPFLLK